MSGEKRLVIVDVEGVLVPRKALLLLNLAGKMGFWWLARNIVRGLAYELRLKTLEEVVRGFYDDLRGFRLEDVVSWYSFRDVNKRLKELSELKRGGFNILLISSGAPRQLVENFASRVGAEAGYGVEVLLDEEGRILGVGESTCLREGGKLELALKHLEGEGEVVVVADDWNNLQLRGIASLFIGFNPDSLTASKADLVVEGRSLQPVVRLLLEGVTPKKDFRRVLVRKLIHIGGVAVVALYLLYPQVALAMMLLATLLYAFSESLRLYGRSVPLISSIVALAARGRELDGIALAPLTYSVGLTMAMLAPPPFSILAMITLTIGDGVAGLVDQALNGHSYPHMRRKRIEGSIAGFIAALAISLNFAEPFTACLSTALGMVAEALATIFDDNLAVVFASLTPMLLQPPS